MNRANRNNRISHHGGRAGEAVDRRMTNEAANSLVFSEYNLSPTVERWQGEVEEARRAREASFRIRSVLVPVDGEPFGEHALPVALGIARRAGVGVRVVYVHSPLQSSFQPGPLYIDDGLVAAQRRRQELYLNDLSRRLRKVSPVPVTPMMVQGGRVAETLCEAARIGTDLVVMATHGRGPLGRLWSGSVADALMRRLSVPLLLVRGYDAPANLTGDLLLRHVLVPLDGSALAEQVLEPALALGSLTDAEHTLLRVLPVKTDLSLGYPGGGAHQALASRHQSAAWDYLRRTALRFRGPAQRVHSRLIQDEQSVAKAILHYARTHDADLIALATRGRGGLSRLLWGSVADRVVRGASVPVLVYRPELEQEAKAAS